MIKKNTFKSWWPMYFEVYIKL